MQAAANSHFERVATAIVTLCVVVVSAAVLFRLLSSRGPDPVERTVSRSEWQDLVRSGTHVGPARAATRVVVFVDYECPFCRVFHRDLMALLEESPVEFAVRVHDYPLTTHSGAVRAAATVHCAAPLLRYQERADRVYAWQDSALRPDVMALARTIDPRDVESVGRCIELGESGTMADSTREAAARFGVRATPTVIVDRKVFRLPPTREALRRVLLEGD
jgi:protein-disulfide isomerase